MKVTIIRHGKVKHIWKKFCSADEFDEECRIYDIAPTEEMASAHYKNGEAIIMTL